MQVMWKASQSIGGCNIYESSVQNTIDPSTAYSIATCLCPKWTTVTLVFNLPSYLLKQIELNWFSMLLLVLSP